MLKAMILNFLLSRGINALQELLAKSVRHGVTTLGGALVAKGLMVSPTDQDTLVGAGLIIVGFALSYVRTYFAKYAAPQA